MSTQTVMYRTSSEIESLIRAFNECKLPRSEWNHHAHLTMALWYLFYYPEVAAVHCIRTGIERYNAAHEIETTPTSGYHETITLFWVKKILQYLAAKGKHGSLVDLTNELIQRYGNPRLLFEYYSRDRLLSSEARNNWVEPDLKPLEPAKVSLNQ